MPGELPSPSEDVEVSTVAPEGTSWKVAAGYGCGISRRGEFLLPLTAPKLEAGTAGVATDFLSTSLRMLGIASIVRIVALVY